MPVPPRPRTAHPILRKAACAVIGLGCLLTAGSVLSSAVQRPRLLQAAQATVFPKPPQVLCAVPVSGRSVAPAAGPLKAVVQFSRGTVRVTNNSRYPWHDVRVRLGPYVCQGLDTGHPGLILPHHTSAIPMSPSLLAAGYACRYSRPLTLQWECRTAQGRGRWQCYLAL